MYSTIGMEKARFPCHIFAEKPIMHNNDNNNKNGNKNATINQFFHCNNSIRGQLPQESWKQQFGSKKKQFWKKINNCTILTMTITMMRVHGKK